VLIGERVNLLPGARKGLMSGGTLRRGARDCGCTPQVIWENVAVEKGKGAKSVCALVELWGGSEAVVRVRKRKAGGFAWGKKDRLKK